MPCLIEAHSTGGLHGPKADANNTCDLFCAGKTTEQLQARQAVQPEHQAAVQAALDQSPNNTFDCFCEIVQLTGAVTPNCSAAPCRSASWTRRLSATRPPT